MGQYAVALVTVNRAKLSGETICDEVFKKNQFSWTTGSSVKHTAHSWRILRHMIPAEAHEWQISQRIAKVVLADKMSDITYGSLFYHTHKVYPVWRMSMVKTKRIGNHQFYKLPISSEQ